MSTKAYVWIGLFVGSTIGSYIPTLWGVGFLSYSSALASAIGGIFGIWAGFKLGNN